MHAAQEVVELAVARVVRIDSLDQQFDFCFCDETTSSSKCKAQILTSDELFYRNTELVHSCFVKELEYLLVVVEFLLGEIEFALVVV